METKKKSFLNYINIFRGLAILLIIMGHTMQFGQEKSLIHLINCEIFCGGTALFIFISGFLFQHLSSKFEYKNYLSKKWLNVIIPYFITAIPGIIFCLCLPLAYKNSFDGLSPFLQIPMFLTTGRIHNTPTWFIPMIVIFFIFSWLLLKLEKKNLLYKFLPAFFLITLFMPRVDVNYDTLISLSYIDKYLACLKYVIFGFIHFFSLYVFGMYCSFNKNIIDKFYNNRKILWILMLSFSIINVYLSYNQIYSSFTISKIFLTMLVLGYLKYYDEKILASVKINNILDFIAKYSFGLFFIHWYWFFVFNQIFNLETVIPIVKNNYFVVIMLVIFRFLFVTLSSLLTLYLSKKFLKKINENINTRMFIGV